MNGSAGGLLLLLSAVFLLVSFFDGKLEWLFHLGADVSAAQGAATATGSATRARQPAPPFTVNYV